jgi:predicted small lipoprotein YifL
MPTMNRLQVMMALGFALSMLAGCEQKGPAEKAGEKVDKAVDQAGKTMEKAGEKVEETAKEAEKKIKEATK